MSGQRFQIYTMRRTSSRTVYAIYDNQLMEPYDRDGRPWTTTDRTEAAQRAYGFNHPPKVAP